MSRQRNINRSLFWRTNGFLDPHCVLFPAALAFCGCFLDVVSVEGLFDTFTAAITGSVVLLFIDLLNNPPAVPIKIIVIVAFVISTLIWHKRIVSLKAKKKRSLKNMLYIEATLLLIFFLIATRFNLSSPLAPATISCVIVSACAMSLQHLITTGILPHALPTTAITGSTVRVITGANDLITSTVDSHEADTLKEKTRVGFITLVFFFIGGLAGILFWKYFKFYSLLVPIVVILTLAYSSKEQL